MHSVMDPARVQCIAFHPSRNSLSKKTGATIGGRMLENFFRSLSIQCRMLSNEYTVLSPWSTA